MEPVCFIPQPQELAVFAQFPPHLARAMRREWLRRRNRPAPGVCGEADAGSWLAPLAQCLPPKGLPLSACEAELVTFAKDTATEGERLRMQGASMGELAAFCQLRGMELPAGDSMESIARRVGCDLWWRRALRRQAARSTETLAIRLGLVHRHRGLYASHDTIKRRQVQRRRNAALLEAMQAVNELGQSFTLAELAEKGMANPALRRAELMTRIAGFEYIARALDMAGEFITLTAPSRFHAIHAKGGRRNDKHDGSTPLDARVYLGEVWSRITAALARAGIKIFGFRVAEPHHDGTPHFHGLFFMPRDAVAQFRRIVARHAVRADREELGLSYCLTKRAAADKARALRAAGQAGTIKGIAERLRVEAEFWAKPPRRVWWAIRARVFFKAINWKLGTAAGYIAKYIAKNIDGQKQDGSSVGLDYEALQGAVDAVETCQRVDAWASCWGIRQFQQVGGPPVGVWRELRRWDYQGAEDVLMLAAVAADAGDWGRFMAVMGGYEAKRKDMPLQLAKEMQAANRYGESSCTPTKVVGVVEVTSGQLAISRMHEWTVSIRREAPAWTGVNNSTKAIDVPQIPPGARFEMSTEEWIAFKLRTEEYERSEAIKPYDDAFFPPDKLAQRQRARRLALQQYEAQRQRLRELPHLVDECRSTAAVISDARHELTKRFVVGRDLYKRVAAPPPGRGLEIIANARVMYEIDQAKRARDAERQPFARWKAADSNSNPITVQLANAVQAARHWVTSTNADEHRVLTLGR